MRPAGPSISALFTSWLSLTQWIFAACFERANAIAEGSETFVRDALMDIGCPPPADGPDGQPLPRLEDEALVTALRQRIERVVQDAADIISEQPHACLTPVTRDRLAALFASLADEALALAAEQRVAAAERLRGDAE